MEQIKKAEETPWSSVPDLCLSTFTDKWSDQTLFLTNDLLISSWSLPIVLLPMWHKGAFDVINGT